MPSFWKHCCDSRWQSNAVVQCRWRLNLRPRCLALFRRLHSHLWQPDDDLAMPEHVHRDHEPRVSKSISSLLLAARWRFCSWLISDMGGYDNEMLQLTNRSRAASAKRCCQQTGPHVRASLCSAPSVTALVYYLSTKCRKLSSIAPWSPAPLVVCLEMCSAVRLSRRSEQPTALLTWPLSRAAAHAKM